MTRALVVMVAALSFGFAGAALAAGAAPKGGSSAASSKASSTSASSSKAAAKGALNANGPSLNGFDGELAIFASGRVILQSEPTPAR